jgi:hypothetical protein
MNLATKVFASQTVGKLMGSYDGKHRKPCQKEGLETEKAIKVLPDFTPVEDGNTHCKTNEAGRKNNKMWREEEPDSLDETVKKAIGIEGIKP